MRAMVPSWRAGIFSKGINYITCEAEELSIVKAPSKRKQLREHA